MDDLQDFAQGKLWNYDQLRRTSEILEWTIRAELDKVRTAIMWQALAKYWRNFKPSSIIFLYLFLSTSIDRWLNLKKEQNMASLTDTVKSYW